MKNVNRKVLCAVAIATSLLANNSIADTLKVGMSTALSGPAQGLGTNVKAGVESYFNEVNTSGGVNGKKLELIALDDGYEPDRAAPNMRQLIDKENVVGVIGNVGTPTAIVTVPIANESKTVLFGSVTGAGVLRKSPPDRYIINYRASYAEETAEMVNGLLKAGVKPEEIAFFTQKDGYGDSGYFGGIKALKAAGYANADQLAHGRYPRNTTNVEDGLNVVLDADVEPKAIIMVGAYKPCAAFIKLAKEELPDALFLNVSFVGSIPLKNELGEKAEGVIVTQIVPHPESNEQGVAEYRAALANHNSGQSPSFMGLEGYLAAKIFVEGIKKSGNSVDRESVVNGLQSLGTIDLKIDRPFMLSEKEHQASHNVWPTQIQGGKYVPLNWADLKVN